MMLFYMFVQALDLTFLCLCLFQCVVKLTQRVLISRLTSVYTQGRNHTDVISRAVSGGLHAPTNLHVTSANTLAPNRSSVRCANDVSHAPTTWPCTWNVTNPKASDCLKMAV